MRVIVIILLGMALFWWWFFAGSDFHCPVCGLELPKDWAHPGQRRLRCRCGWSDEV